MPALESQVMHFLASTQIKQLEMSVAALHLVQTFQIEYHPSVS